MTTPDFFPEEIRSHLLSVHKILNDNVMDHISDCRCEGCLIRKYNSQLIKESDSFRNFKELRLVTTVKNVYISNDGSKAYFADGDNVEVIVR